MAQLKSTNITGDLSVTGELSASKLLKIGGTNTQILMADGSIKTAATTNTANTMVLRDANGNFSAGTITATLSGKATEAKLLIPTETDSKITYGVGTWTANASALKGKIVWREKFVHSDLGTDSGDIVLWLNNATTLNVTIDGYYYQNHSYKVLDTSNVSGTTNYIPKFTSTNVIGNSRISDNGSLITLGGNTSISGTAKVSGATTLSSTLSVAGVATFSSTAVSSKRSEGAVKVVGGVGVGGQLSANTVMVGDEVTLQYDSGLKAMKFVF